MAARARRWMEAYRDFATIAVQLATFVAIAIAFDLAEWFDRFAAEHEHLQLDQVAFAAAATGPISLLLLIRYTCRLRRELRLRRRAEADARALALRDPLTGLPNRRGMLMAIDSERQALREGHTFSVLMVDLDRFKPVNDT